MKIKSEKDFYSGVLFCAVGVAFAWGATAYPLGTAARMGPGYFPLVLGVLLTLIGAATVVRALAHETPDGEPVGPWAWRPLCFVLGANLLFGALLAGVPALGIPQMGLVVATLALTVVAALGGREFRLREVLVLAGVLALGTYLAFVLALNLQFPVWPAFLTQ